MKSADFNLAATNPESIIGIEENTSTQFKSLCRNESRNIPSANV